MLFVLIVLLVLLVLFVLAARRAQTTVPICMQVRTEVMRACMQMGSARWARRVQILGGTGRALGAVPTSSRVEGNMRELLDVAYATDPRNGFRATQAYGAILREVAGPRGAVLTALRAVQQTVKPEVDGLIWSDPAANGASPRVARRGLPAELVDELEAVAREHPVVAEHLRPGLAAHLRRLQAIADGGERCRCGLTPRRSAVAVDGPEFGHVHYTCPQTPPVPRCDFRIKVIREDGSQVLAAGRQAPARRR